MDFFKKKYIYAFIGKKKVNSDNNGVLYSNILFFNFKFFWIRYYIIY